MNRRITFMLTGMTALGLAIGAFPQLGFAQNDPWLGTWQLNLTKSKFNPGPPPKSQTINIQGEGQNRKATGVGIDAEGKPTTFVQEFVVDGAPHSRMGSPIVDARAYTGVDVYNINFNGMKAGKVVQTGTYAISPDGKTWTVTIGTNANGRQINNIFVYDKQ
jgi:hypothetical protein